MTNPGKEVFVPATEPGAYNPGRAAGKLLQAQASHLQEALLQCRKELEGALAIDPKALKTELEVSAYIERATAILHTLGAQPKTASK